MGLWFGVEVTALAFGLILLSSIAIAACLVVLWLDAQKKKHVNVILNRLDLLREGKVEKQAPKLEIKKEEFSLKKLLISKFKPLIEKQLKTKVEILDFNAKGDTFLALVQVANKKLLLVLDASGNITDYKKVK